MKGRSNGSLERYSEHNLQKYESVEDEIPI